MFNDLSLGFFERPLRERHDHSHHNAHVDYRESWQSFEFKLLNQFRIALTIFGPIQLGSGDEPGGASSQSGMMLPDNVLLGLKLICDDFIFAILDHPFDKIATAQQFCQKLQRCICQCVAESIGVVAIALDPHCEPFLMESNVRLFIIPYPYLPGCKAVFQDTSFIGADTQELPVRIGKQPNLSDPIRAHLIQHLDLLHFGTFLPDLGSGTSTMGCSK